MYRFGLGSLWIPVSLAINSVIEVAKTFPSHAMKHATEDAHATGIEVVLEPGKPA